MDILIEKYQAKEDQPGYFSAALKTLLQFIGWPVRFFTLTEAERQKAGIYLGGEGRGRVARLNDKWMGHPSHS